MSFIRREVCGENRNIQKPQAWTDTKHCASGVYDSTSYANHCVTVHPEKCLRSLQNQQSVKRRRCDVSDLEGSTNELDIASLTAMLAPNYSSNSELVSEGCDREAREFSDKESDEGTGQSDAINLIFPRRAGQPPQQYLCPEQDAGFDWYAPLPHLIDYRLIRFFHAAKTSQFKIDKFSMMLFSKASIRCMTFSFTLPTQCSSSGMP